MSDHLFSVTKSLSYFSNLCVAGSLYSVILFYLSSQKQKPILELSRRILGELASASAAAAAADPSSSPLGEEKMDNWQPTPRPIQRQIKMEIQTRLDTLSHMRLKYKQYLKSNTLNKIIDPAELLSQWNGKYKRLMVITPGGFYGYYMLGVTRYIKKNYDLDEYVFSGSSAGAWCALFLCLKDKKHVTMLLFQLVQSMQDVIASRTMYDFLFVMKQKVLELTTTADYHLDRLHIGVLNYENYELKTTIYCDFVSLEDAVNCCISSSNIPFLTGEFSHTYQGSMALDGVFAKYPYLNVIEPSLVIYPDIWKTPHRKQLGNSLLSKEKVNLWELFLDGYNDTIVHHDLVSEFLE
jgi:hypothetical protein